MGYGSNVHAFVRQRIHNRQNVPKKKTKKKTKTHKPNTMLAGSCYFQDPFTVTEGYNNCVPVFDFLEVYCIYLFKTGVKMLFLHFTVPIIKKKLHLKAVNLTVT